MEPFDCCRSHPLDAVLLVPCDSTGENKDTCVKFLQLTRKLEGYQEDTLTRRWWLGRPCALRQCQSSSTGFESS